MIINRAIVLVSGGMDSLVTAAVAMRDNDECYFLHVNYGQLTEDKELECFSQICAHYQPAGFKTASIAYLADIGGSSLTDKNLQVLDHEESEAAIVPNTYVPFRNAHLMAIATSWAEVIGANRLYIGAVEEDSSGYPDCREAFYQSLEQSINLGTKDDTQIEIITPIIHLSKASIVKLGKELNAPFAYSWSCYRSNEIACGSCDSCYLRLKAFREAGCEDPIPYAKQ